MYYIDGLTQKQIAATLGLSRMGVSRLLQRARDEGVVRVEIKYDGYSHEMEERLASAFPGVQAIVTSGLDGSETQRITAAASSAANILGRRLSASTTVAVGWGTTLSATAGRLSSPRSGARFAPMIGGQGFVALDVHATQIANVMATRTGGTACQLLAPASMRSVREHTAFVANPGIARVLETAAAADIAIFSVGAPFAPGATLQQSGYFAEEDIDLLRREHAESDIVSLCYLDSGGRSVAEQLAARAISITKDDLLKIPYKILVAVGEEKVTAIRLALRAGFADVFTTDSITAGALLADGDS